MNTRSLLSVLVALLVVVGLVVPLNAEPRASASHILVKTHQQALDLKERIENGEDFAELAKSHSTCPSGRKGGSLGQFGPGQMVKEFNDVVFNDEVGVVHGPVKTQFGYHLILITDRSD